MTRSVISCAASAPRRLASFCEPETTHTRRATRRAEAEHRDVHPGLDLEYALGAALAPERLLGLRIVEEGGHRELLDLR